MESPVWNTNAAWDQFTGHVQVCLMCNLTSHPRLLFFFGMTLTTSPFNCVSFILYVAFKNNVTTAVMQIQQKFKHQSPGMSCGLLNSFVVS